jgi:hypothetical protein
MASKVVDMHRQMDELVVCMRVGFPALSLSLSLSLARALLRCGFVCMRVRLV